MPYNVTLYVCEILVWFVETAGGVESLISLFKNVASAEPNSEMQKTIFSMATQYESLRSHLDIYAACEEQTAMILDEAKLYVVSPVRVSGSSFYNRFVSW